MKLQVEQLEKEKKDLNQRLRIVAKRVDHIERAYRKEERPLLGQDYEEQQANDRLTFEAVQKARIEGSKISHQHDIETKKRLSRMMDDYKSRRDVIAGKRGDDYARQQAIAARKIGEERAKRRKAVLQEREEERLRIETEERARREKEEEEARLKGLSKRTTPLNIFPLLFAAQHAMEKLNAVIDTWADTSREMVLSARKLIDDVLCVRAEECFEMGEWVEILESDGGRSRTVRRWNRLWC